MAKKIFIGLDVHKETIAMVGLDEEGKQLVGSIIATETDLVQQSLSGLADEIEVAFEVGTQSNLAVSANQTDR
jgi:hypothetical protein